MKSASGKKILRGIGFFFLGLAMLPLLLLTALHIPAVQNSVKDKVTRMLSEKLKTRVAVQKVQIGIFRDVVVEGIYLEDRRRDTLVYAGELQVSVKILPLLKRKLVISEIFLKDAYLNTYRRSGEKDFNFSFIAAAFKDSSKASSAPWTFDIHTIELQNVRTKFDDVPGGTLVHASVGALGLDIGSTGISNGRFVAEEADIKSMVMLLEFRKPELAVQQNGSAAPPPAFGIKDLAITESRFIYNNYLFPALSKGFDYNRMDIRSISGGAKDITVQGKNVALTVEELALNEKCGFRLQDLGGILSLTKDWVNIDIDGFQTPQSILKNHLTLNVPLKKGVSIGEMKIEGAFSNEKIALHDLQFFVPALDTLKPLKGKVLSVSGNLQGKMADFKFRDALLALNGETVFRGNAQVRGMPQFKTSYLDLDIRELHVDARLLRSFVQDTAIPVNLALLGEVHAHGKVQGYVTRPEIHMNVSTLQGSIAADIRLETDTSFQSLGYHGTVSTTNFNAAKVFKQQIPLGKISLSAFASGRNLEVKEFRGTVSEAEYNNYSYRDLSLEGSYTGGNLNARFIAKDTNLKAALDIHGNMTGRQYQVSGNIGRVDLYALHFYPSPFVFSSQVNGNVKGSHPDSLSGVLALKQLTMSNGRREYHADSVNALAAMDPDGNHTITLAMPEIQGMVKGNFRFEEIPVLVNNYMHSYLKNTSAALAPLRHTHNIEISLEAGDVTPLAMLFVPELTALDSVHLQGTYTNENRHTHLELRVRNLKYGDKNLQHTAFRAEGSGDDLRFTGGIENIGVNKNFSIDHAVLSGILKEKKLQFNVALYAPDAPTHVSLTGNMHTHGDTMYLSFPDAAIYLKGQSWTLDKGNHLVYAKEYLMLRDFIFTGGDQQIVLNSSFTRQESVINGSFKNVHADQVSQLGGFAAYKMQGSINGSFRLSDPLAGQGLEAAIQIDSFGMNHMLLGELKVSANKKANEDGLSLNASIRGQGNSAALAGTVPLSDKKSWNLQANIGQLALHPWEPFVKSFAYSLEGNIQGNFLLSGPLNTPVLTGTLMFPGTNRIGVNLFHTAYSIRDQKIVFAQDAIQFKDFSIQDTLGNKAIANGNIYHQGFKEIRMDLRVHADNFEVVNSGITENALLYGQLFVKMSVNLQGPVDDLMMDLDVVTLKGSRIFVPLASAKPSGAIPVYIHFDEIEQEGADTIYVSADSSYRTRRFQASSRIDFSKFDVRGNVRINKDAEVNIVVDPVNGDKITARGDGVFSMDFDSQNNVNLYGVYTIDNGSYDFSFVNLIKKNFKIEKGGTISWSGDFAGAVLDITALYESRASRYELVEDQADFMNKEQIDAAKRPLPVNVYLHLTGQLMSPVIAFNIKAPEGGDPMAGNVVVQKIAQINNDPNELNKQVFSLIVLNRFATSSATSAGGGGVSGSGIAMSQVNQSVSRLLNTQLNRLSSDYLSGVDINVNLQSLDPSYGPLAQNAQVTVSKKVSDRISVSAGGNVNINSSYGSGQFVGDYNVYYHINPNGSANIRFFRTSTQTIYSNNLTTQSGFSLSYRREFNRWSRLFRRRRGNEKEAGKSGKDDNG